MLFTTIFAPVSCNAPTGCGLSVAIFNGPTPWWQATAGAYHLRLLSQRMCAKRHSISAVLRAHTCMLLVVSGSSNVVWRCAVGCTFPTLHTLLVSFSLCIVRVSPFVSIAGVHLNLAYGGVTLTVVLRVRV